MADRDTPNQAANKAKAEGERWSSNADTVERRDRESQGNQDRTEGTTEHDAAGITNRPLEEEEDNQAAVPPRGETREGAHAGHGERNRSER